MSLFSDGFPFGIGETMIGTDNDKLVNVSLEGREAFISHDAIPNVGSPLFDSRVGLRSKVRIMRNTTGGKIYAGELVVPDKSDDEAKLGQASAVTAGGEPDAVIVDPTLSTAGVEDDDLFIAFVSGPAKVKAPAAGLVVASAGIPLVAGALGRAATGTLSQAVLLESLKVWDAMQTNIAVTPANDDLGLVTGTLGTSVPSVQSGDGKATTVTRYAAFSYRLPDDYIAGTPVNITLNAGMLTTVSDDTATVDLNVYRHAAPTVDVCATAAQTINSLTASDKTLALTATNLVPGEQILVRVTVSITDASTGTAVIGKINSIAVQSTVNAASGRRGVFLETGSIAANALAVCLLD